MTSVNQKLFVIAERDVGLFSLIQQVISNIPRALNDGRVPIAVFGKHCAYWVPGGYAQKNNVWEYYFEPLIPQIDMTTLPDSVRDYLHESPPRPKELGVELDAQTYISWNFGDDRRLSRQTLTIPYMWQDPDEQTRQNAARIMRHFIRPRTYIQQKVTDFYESHLQNEFVIGVHIRGTDAISATEKRGFRQNSLQFPAYFSQIDQLLESKPNSKLFIATDAERSLELMQERYGARIVAYDSLRHQAGKGDGVGPTGAIMPKYILQDVQTAARNGEEALIEYLLLCRCQHLVHNGSGLARTVLLTRPELTQSNTHKRTLRKWLNRLRPRDIESELRYRLRSERHIDFDRWGIP